MQRPVRRGIGDIFEKRLTGMGRRMLVNVGNRLIADGIGIKKPSARASGSALALPRVRVFGS